MSVMLVMSVIRQCAAQDDTYLHEAHSYLSYLSKPTDSIRIVLFMDTLRPQTADHHYGGWR